MGFSAPFIARPVATILLSLGLLLSGIVAYRFLPISPLPSVDIPTIVVFAARPGADPETMANSIAAPLERRLGEIPGVTELTSTSSTGSSAVIIQFDIGRDIDGAAHDVQAAINAATSDLPSDLPTRPYYRKINPADTPILTLALTSDTLSTAAMYDAVDTILAQRLAQVDGVAQVVINGSEKPAVRVQLDPARLTAAGLSAQDVFTKIRASNVLQPNGGFQGPARAESIGLNGQMSQAPDYARLVLKSANGAVIRLSDVANVVNGVANSRLAAWSGKQPAILLSITKDVERERHRDRGPGARTAAATAGLDAAGHPDDGADRPDDDDPRQRGRHPDHAADRGGAGAAGGVRVHAPADAHAGGRGDGAAVALRHRRGHVVLRLFAG